MSKYNLQEGYIQLDIFSFLELKETKEKYKWFFSKGYGFDKTDKWFLTGNQNITQLYFSFDKKTKEIEKISIYYPNQETIKLLNDKLIEYKK